MSDSIIPLLGLIALAVVASLILIRPIRRAVISRPLFSTYRKVLPQMTATERDALEAGTVWWEGELFRGKPDWKKLHAYPKPTLSAVRSFTLFRFSLWLSQCFFTLEFLSDCY